MIVRSGFPFNYDTDAESELSGLSCGDRSLAVQSGVEEADINTIVKRFGITGQLPQGVRVPAYQDFEGVFDYQSAMNVLLEAQKSFMQMPADVRKRFDNDPAEFVAFVEKEENREEAERLGIVPKRPPPPPKAEDVKPPETA